MEATTARPEVCVGAVAVVDERLLLIRRNRDPGRGLWSLPGGRVERGETLAEAVVRELREETGIDGVCGAMLGWVERIGEHHHFVILDFTVVALDDPEPTPGDDASEAAWVPLHQVAELDLVDGLAEFLADEGIIDLLA